MIPSAGVPWGGHSLRLGLPTASVELTGLSGPQLAAIRDSYPGLLRDDAPAESESDSVTCRAYRLARPPAISISDVTEAGQYAPRKVRRPGEIALTGIDFEARVGLQDTHAVAALGVAEERELAGFGVIENFLRVLTAYRALRKAGVLLHSAGLVRQGRAYVFAGRSGAGKTTLARKADAAGMQVLSDDLNLVLPDQGGYRAHAVPFTGELGRAPDPPGGKTSYPVAGLVLLSQGDRLRAEPLRPSHALARLLVACPFVNTDAEELQVLFEVLGRLLVRVPVIELGCRRDQGIETIMQAVTNGISDAEKSG